MKRYVVFGGDVYYPMGGGEDYLMSYDDLEEARDYAELFVKVKGVLTWSHVFDSVEKKVIFQTRE